jgi:ATP-dependent DNA helicase RecG
MSSSARNSLKRSDARHPLTTSVRRLPGVGARRETLLNQLGIATVGDLLAYPPRRYIDRTSFSRIADLRHGEIQSVIATVTNLEVKPARGRRLFITHVDDTSGRMRCVWFNQPYLRNVFRQGETYVFSGRAQVDRFGRAMVHPEYEAMADELVHTGRVVPVYGLKPGISQRQLRLLVRSALDMYLDEVADCLPETLRSLHALLPIGEAIRGLHFPREMAEAEEARRRLAFDEMLMLQTLFALSRLERKDGGAAAGVSRATVAELCTYLPFDLTASQRSALLEIVGDIGDEYPMRRLLQGDVGCGKTVVASLAAALVCRRGGQVALMCPTELLAEQHYATLTGLLFPFGYSAGLLTGSMAPDERQRTEEAMQTGDLDVVVGTHTLIGERAAFNRLELIIVDEEQRFGVLQRTRLVRKAPYANLLVISATPIPRTLALTAYGDLDATVIGEMPPGRGRHSSRAVAEQARQDAIREVAGKIEAGLQGFYVCPAIDEGEAGLTDVGKVRHEMRTMLPPARGVAILTGRTPRPERLKLMDDFRANRIGLIVATSVVEVGMDIPSATILVVDQAERFGLSQLHQMRGRVARGAADSFSYFIVSDSASDEARARVAVLESSFDGFDVAEKDLMFRGPGDIVGTRQHGIPYLRYARLPEDLDLMLAARQEAFDRILGGEPSSEWGTWLEAVRGYADGKMTMV